MSLDKPAAGETLANAKHRELHRVISADSAASEDRIAVYKREIRASTDILNLGERPINMMGTSLDGVADYDVPEQQLYPYPKPSYCRVRLDADQDINNGLAWVTIQFETVTLNTGEYNTGTYMFTATEPGIYHVKSSALFKETIADQKEVRLAITVSGAYVAMTTLKTAMTATESIQVSDVLQLHRGDYVEIDVAHDHTEARQLDGQTHTTYLSIVRIA